MTKRRALVLASVLCLGTLIWILWFHLGRKGPPAIYDDPVEQFKYGAIGQNPGFPVYLWTVMPEVFADLLPQPGGWEVFGFIDEGRGYPVGFAKQRIGFESLSFNCALCHTGQYQMTPTSPRVVVPGAPANTLDFEGFNQFVFAAVQDPRFRPDVLLPAIEARFELSFSERWVYRYALLPAIGKALRQQAEAGQWMSDRPAAGRGRFDAFNLLKIAVMELPDDGSIATSDFTSLYNQGKRSEHFLHWNGCNQLRQDNLMSAYSVNLGSKGFLPESFDRMVNYLHDLAPPAFPFPVDSAMAARGATLYDTHCTTCHSFEGELVGQVTDIESIGTDPAFLEMWTEEFVGHLKSVDDPPFSFSELRRTNGYLNVPLDGVWIRAPYLHNGSVPSLSALLEPGPQRPQTFLRGHTVYDPSFMGFVFEAGSGVRSQATSTYQTDHRGNSNRGHEYGTQLLPEEKADLVEYLKTL